MATQQVETQPESEPPDSEQACRFSYRPAPECAGEARREVGALLRKWGFADVEFDLLVCLDEAFTNALFYGNGPEITVIVTTSGPAVRIEVEDCAGEASTLAIEVPAEADATVTVPVLASVAEGGRGLFLIAGLTTRWGVRPLGATAKGVWFELDTSAPAVAS
jgi:anti-sigma regulatory factor (Ser/Thr protein kinase)